MATAPVRGRRKLAAPASSFPRMTYEEFVVHPDIPERAEWVDGRVELMVSVSLIHNQLTSFLIALMGAFAEYHQLGQVLHDPFNMKLSPSLPGRAPDLLVVLTEHLGRLRGNHLAGPADIAVEVVSPSNADTDRVAKFREYEAGGVTEYWLIDPQRQEAEFFRLDSTGHYAVVETEGGVFQSQVLRGFLLRVAWLWGRPTLREAEIALGIR